MKQATFGHEDSKLLNFRVERQVHGKQQRAATTTTKGVDTYGRVTLMEEYIYKQAAKVSQN